MNFRLQRSLTALLILNTNNFSAKNTREGVMPLPGIFPAKESLADRILLNRALKAGIFSAVFNR